MGKRLWSAVAALVFSCVGTAQAQSPQISDPFIGSTAAIMVPGATRSFLVDTCGHLSNGVWKVRLDPAADGRLAAAPTAIRWTDGPAVTAWERSSGPLLWSFEAVAVKAFQDTGLAVSLQVAVRNHGSRPVNALLRVTLESVSGAEFVATDAPESLSARDLAWAADPGSETDNALAWCDITPVGEHTARWQWTVPPGATRRARVIVPCYPTASSELNRWSAESHEKRLNEARDLWQREFDKTIELHLSDYAAETAFRAALGVLIGCTELHDERLLPIGNPFQYRDVWIRDSARAMVALALAGKRELASELVGSLLLYQWPQGPFLSQRGQLDGTGQALWALDGVLLRGGVVDREVADAAYLAWKWCEIQRTAATLLRLPTAGLMPYCTPRDAELPVGYGPLVGTDAWAIAGYRSAGRLLERAGRTADARQVRRSMAAYERRFESALDSLGTDGISPMWGPGGRDWGNVSVAYPCGALPPHHPRCRALAKRLWADGPGLVHCGGGDTLHTYLSADLAHWAMLVGDQKSAVAVLSQLMYWRTASGGSPEVFDSRARSYGSNLPPHATAAAAIVTLIRNMVLYDEDDTLRLTLGAPEAWWHGSTIRRAPTRWGVLDVRFHSDQRHAEWSWTPVPVPTVLSLPPNTELDEGARVPVTRRNQVVVPPGVAHYRATLRTVSGG